MGYERVLGSSGTIMGVLLVVAPICTALNVMTMVLLTAIGRLDGGTGTIDLES